MNTDGVLTVDGEVNFVNNTAGSYSGGEHPLVPVGFRSLLPMRHGRHPSGVFPEE